jgi:hypothetical protein
LAAREDAARLANRSCFTYAPYAPYAPTLGAQRTMTASVDAIDSKVPSISFTGPNGWKYSRRVLDKNVLKQVKVGDQVDFTWTEAVQIAIETPKD